MTAERVRQQLDAEGVDYHVDQHERAISAQEVAASEHESGWHLAKPVLLQAGGRLVMTVLPAPMDVDLAKARAVFDTDDVRLAAENDFAEVFDDCDTGAEPPFGNLYGLPVYVDHSLLHQPEIIFRAGSHTETIRLSIQDYLRLVQPDRVDIGVPAD